MTCCGDIRIKITRKHKNTALWTAGELGIVRRLSASLSKIEIQQNEVLGRKDKVIYEKCIHNAFINTYLECLVLVFDIDLHLSNKSQMPAFWVIAPVAQAQFLYSKIG